ncbi:hypothetical protein LJR009_002940 [Bosea sp. LjRoot9]|uniref:Pnap_2097 family protein n=1 Tax=Bosea sp. LjRoot9 TaxID=3342341 RepID=UPI003ECF4BA7
MNIAVSPLPATQETQRIFASRDHLRLGMPHLACGGLSETWLLKELGHRHWTLLARMVGLEVPDFRDEAGDRVYAAFCSVSIRDAAFTSCAEHDNLVVSSEIARISRTRFASIHRLSRRGQPMGCVSLCSVFVKRRQAGRNRSIARVAIVGFPAVEDARTFAHVAEMAAMIRGEWVEHFGLRNDAARPLRSVTVHPCPSQDFNGADFLYFAAFQAFVDRAEWEIFGAARPALATLARDIVYHGNIEVGERLTLDLRDQKVEGDILTHWFQIVRGVDGSKVADVFTRRAIGMPS